MTITFTGNEIPETERILTGFYSLDKALRNPITDAVGFPINTMVEIYGPAGIGKTTFMMTLGGLFARQLGGKIAFADLEGQSRDTVVNALSMGGFSGELDLCRGEKVKTHSDILDKMLEEFRQNDCSVSMLDSVGAFMPPGEADGSVVDANMGQRPRIIGNWTRKVVDILSRDGRKVCMYVTHQHSNIGFVGTHTSGGETKKFLNAVQIRLKQKDEYEGGWLLEGKVEKNRFGKADEFFRVFCIGGQGIHKGLSAVFDCVAAGLAEIERNTVRIGDNSYGKVARMIETWQEDDQFAPFYNLLSAGQEEDAPVESVEDFVAKRKKKK